MLSRQSLKVITKVEKRNVFLIKWLVCELCRQRQDFKLTITITITTIIIII